LYRYKFRQELVLWSLYADARGDETFTREGTRALFDWHRHGFDIVNQASIMTLYQRDLNNARFTMFFTGDAYDSCLSVSSAQVMGLIRPANSISAVVFVNVLKARTIHGCFSLKWRTDYLGKPFADTRPCY